MKEQFNNKNKFEELMKKDPDHYFFSKYREAYGIRVTGDDIQQISEQLTDLTKPFEMQDIQEGKMTEEGFLMDIVGLVRHEENPEAEEFLKNHSFPKMEDYADSFEFLRAMDKYNKLMPPMYIKALDKEQIT